MVFQVRRIFFFLISNFNLMTSRVIYLQILKIEMCSKWCFISKHSITVASNYSNSILNLLRFTYEFLFRKWHWRIIAFLKTRFSTTWHTLRKSLYFAGFSLLKYLCQGWSWITLDVSTRMQSMLKSFLALCV